MGGKAPAAAAGAPTTDAPMSNLRYAAPTSRREYVQSALWLCCLQSRHFCLTPMRARRHARPGRLTSFSHAGGGRRDFKRASQDRASSDAVTTYTLVVKKFALYVRTGLSRLVLAMSIIYFLVMFGYMLGIIKSRESGGKDHTYRQSCYSFEPPYKGK